MMYFCKVKLSVPASPASTLLPPPLLLPLPPLRQQNQFLFFLLLSSLNVKMMKMKTFMMIYFHLKSSKYSSCYTVNKLIKSLQILEENKTECLCHWRRERSHKTKQTVYKGGKIKYVTISFKNFCTRKDNKYS